MSGAQAQPGHGEGSADAAVLADAPAAEAATDWNNYEKLLLTKDTGEPIDLAVLPDSRVLHTARDGVVRLTDPATGRTEQVARLDVYANSEDGLQGVALDPDFEENGWVYISYAPREMSGTSPSGVDYPATTPGGSAPERLPEGADAETYWDQWLGYNLLSRFRWDTETSTLDLTTEQEIIKVDAQRGQCCHVGADIVFDGDGNLYLSAGDNTPAGTPGANGYAPNNNAPGMNPGLDARRGAGNTNDLRGAILRINVLDDIAPGAETGPGSTYTIPAGNLFTGEEYDEVRDQVREELYVMGLRNPFRIEFDVESNALVWGDYGPDAGGANAQRGPMGYVEWQLTTEAMNGGWPYCHGPNDGGAYNEWDFATATPGDFFDCDAPVNNSTWNTGLTALPPVTEPQIWYGDRVGDQPWDEMIQFSTAGGQAPMAGPIFRHDPENTSTSQFPEFWDGKAFFAEFSMDYAAVFTLDELTSDGVVTDITNFLPNSHLTSVVQPIWDNVMDMEFGPDGSLYVLEYGDGFFRQNPDAGLYRVDYAEGNKTPQANVVASPNSGTEAPLTVTFDATGSRDPEGQELTFAWDFEGTGTFVEGEATASHTYDKLGQYDVGLRVTDAGGKFALTTLQITVGNTAPEVSLDVAHGAFFSWGDAIPVSVDVTDAEDGDEPNCGRVAWTFGLGHNEHAHPEVSGTGCDFTIQTSVNAKEHGEGEKIYGTLVVTYTDQAQGDVPAARGEVALIIKPETQPGPWYDAAQGVEVVQDETAEANEKVVSFDAGDWIAYEPVSFTHAPTGSAIDTVTGRAAGEGTLSLHWNDHRAEPFAQLAFAGGEGWQDVEAAVDSVPEGTGTVYVTSTGGLELDSLTFGASSIVVPETPKCLTGRSDDFTGDALDTDRWTVIRQDDNLRIVDGHLVMPTSNTDINGTSNSNTPNLVLQDLPDGEFTATTKVTMEGTGAYQQAGLVIYGDDDNYAKMVLQERTADSAERVFQFIREENAVPNEVTASNTAPLGASYPDTVWVRFTSDGQNLKASYSANGVDFTEMPQTKSLAGIANPKIGLFAVQGSARPQAPVDAFFDYFSFSPDDTSGVTGPNDEFDGDALDPCLWDVVRPADEHLQVTDGQLILNATAGDIFGTTNTNPSNFVVQDLEGDWVVETVVDVSETSRRYEQGGLIAYIDDDNYVKFDVLTTNQANQAVVRNLEIRSEIGGVVQQPQPNSANVTATVWHLRLEKSGDTFTGSYSTDGESWTAMPAVSNPGVAANGKVGLFALAEQSTDNAPIAFEYFRVLEDEEPEEPAEPILIPAEKVSIGLYSLIPWVNADGLPAVLARLAEIGFENIEPFGSNFNGYTAQEFRDMADELGLSVLSSHYNVGEANFDDTLAFVDTLGQVYVGSGGFPSPGINTYENTLATAETMDRLGQRSVEAGVGKLFGHNHDREFTTIYEHEGEELSAWEILVEETDPDYVTFQVDVAWAAHAGVDVAELLEEYGDRIELLHIKDATGLGSSISFTKLGEGDVPLQEILAAAEEHANIALYVMEYDQSPVGEAFSAEGFEYLTGVPAGQPTPEPVLVPVEKVSLGLYSLIPWANADGLPAVLNRLASIGFENVEPYGGNFNGYDAASFRALTDSLGLAVPSSHYNVGEAGFDATLDFVQTLGQEFVGSGGFPAPGINTYENTLATAETMDRLGQRSVEAGVGKLFGHNHAGEFTTTYTHEGEVLSAWEILVKETNPEFVTFQVDVAWAEHGGFDVAELLEEYGSRIELLHIKDATGLGGSISFTKLGEGDVPLQEILAAAQEHADIKYYVMEYDVSPVGEAFAAEGFEYLTGIPAGEATEFTPVSATPAEVTFDDQDGTADDTFTVPTTVGVQYYVGDQVIGAGTHAGEGTVTVTAQPRNGFAIADGATAEWSHAFSTEGGEPVLVEVTPAEVTFDDQDGTEDDSYTIPEVEGVEYVVDGDVVAADTYPGAGTEDDSYTIPEVEGVEYVVDGDVVAADTYPGAGTVTVTARALDGFVLAEGATAEWSHEFSADGGEPVLVEVTPTEVTFDDQDGTEDDSYTIPEVEGVEYVVDGDAVAADTYPGTGTVTVTARALDGFVLAEGATAEWSHEFSTEG
ncbi:DUF1349 domain-containing protein, partial [Georgenia sp. MJ170]|uniref:beta-xylosidase family glycoside hydrolase n=1 Tax=Georgenia sunbinii TaxID=3117728 RepID=UPI002F26C377